MLAVRLLLWVICWQQQWVWCGKAAVLLQQLENKQRSKEYVT